jgi:hypothetical protein
MAVDNFQLDIGANLLIFKKTNWDFTVNHFRNFLQ